MAVRGQHLHVSSDAHAVDQNHILPEQLMVEQLERAYLYAKWKNETKRARKRDRLEESWWKWWRRKYERDQLRVHLNAYDDKDRYYEVEDNAVVNFSATWALANWRPLTMTFLIAIMRQISLVTSPLFIKFIVSELENDNPEMSRVFIFLFLFLSLILLGGLCYRINCYKLSILAINLRAVLYSLITKKGSRLAPKELNLMESAKVKTILSNDVERCTDFIRLIHQLLLSPLAIIGILALLFFVLGISFLAGASIIASCLIINSIIFMYISKHRKSQIMFTENRLQRFYDVLKGAKALKCMIWEMSAERFCTEPRQEELRACRYVLVLESLQISVFLLSAPLAMLASFALYTSRDLELSPSIIFSALSLIIALRVPLIAFPASIAAYIQASIAEIRISAYLNSDENSSYRQKANSTLPLARRITTGSRYPEYKKGYQYGYHNEIVVSFRHCYLSWNDKEVVSQKACFTRRDSHCSIAVNLGSEAETNKPNGFKLSDINIDIRRGELIVVIGNIGSGKTALINAIQGEMSVIDGKRLVVDDCALVPQSPWHFEGTVRENICMGNKVGRKRRHIYEKVVWSVDLHHDFASWPNGDSSTMASIRDRMSGGQRTRINIARAAYSNRSIVLLDDCLVGIDASVLRKVFVRCVNGLMKKKTRILVSRDPYIIKMADRIVIMDKGRLLELGSGKKVSTLYSENKTDIASLLLKTYGDSFSATPRVMPQYCTLTSDRLYSECISSEAPKPSLLENLTVRSHPLSTWRHHHVSILVPEEHAGDNDQAFADLVTLPSCRTSWTLYLSYFTQGGLIEWSFIFVLIFTAQISNSLTEFVLSRWSQSKIDDGTQDDDIGGLLALYGGIVGIYCLCLFVASGLQAITGLRFATTFYEKLLRSILFAKLSFFNIVSIGHVISIFHRDIDVVDNVLVPTLNVWLITIATILGAGVVLAISIPYVMVAFIVFIFLCAVLILWHRMALAPLIESEIKTRILMFTSMHQSVKRVGIVMHRSYAYETEFFEKITRIINQYSRKTLDITILNCWLGAMLEILGIILVAASCAVALVLHKDVGPARAAVVINNAWLVATVMSASAEMFLQMDQKMQSVSRILHFSELPEREHFAPKQMSSLAEYSSIPFVFDMSRLHKPPGWPRHGDVKIENLFFKYEEAGRDILRRVNLNIKSGMFASIVGRTGSGKSSLSSVILGLSTHYMGSITIDGVESKRVGLHSLRSCIGYLPQEPWLFKGTLRQQLDLASRHSDERIAEVLCQVGLTVEGDRIVLVKDNDEVHKSYRRPSPRQTGKVPSEQWSRHLNAQIDTLMSDHFTVGQKQLLCLARLILHDPKIYILDEATAHVDLRSEERILATIKEMVRHDRTVIWIAHKLQTVLDSSDFICVMDGGLIVEQGKPAELLKETGSILYRLVRPKKGKVENGRQLENHNHIDVKCESFLKPSHWIPEEIHQQPREKLKKSLSSPNLYYYKLELTGSSQEGTNAPDHQEASQQQRSYSVNNAVLRTKDL